MHKPQSLTDFYQHKLQRPPEPLPPGLGHFNVFSVDEFVSPHAKQLPFSRKDFYKIMLISGHSRFHYADKTVEFATSALLFANPPKNLFLGSDAWARATARIEQLAEQTSQWQAVSAFTDFAAETEA